MLLQFVVMTFNMNRKEKTILVTIVANIILVLLKFFLSNSSGSLALRASAWHSVGDVFVSVFVLLGLLSAGWEAKRRLQAGTIENVVALIVSGLMFFTALDIFREVTGAAETPDLRNIWPVTIGAFLTIVITYFTARYKEYVGRATNSLSLVASGYHSRMDLYASVLVVVGLVAAAVGFPALDKLAAIAVIVLIVTSGWEIAESAIHALKTNQTLPLHLEGHHHLALFRNKRMLTYLGGIAVLFILLSGIYTVSLGEQAVVQRLGGVAGTFGPGLHIRVPLIDSITRVNVDEVRQVETEASLVLTGDTNLINTKLTVQYTITNPANYLFSTQNPENLLAKETETAFRTAVAQKGVDDLLTASRSAILAQTSTQTQNLLEEHNTGIKVMNIQLLSVTPPSEVADAFLDVASAREDKNTYMNEALAYKNETVALARGNSSKQITEAQAQKTSKIALATGEAERFSKKLSAYQTAPVATRTRLYLESLEKVLPNIKKYILDPRVETNSTDLWITNGQTTAQP
ncbi:MAG: HflK protein [Microgenomates group bacterium GW2011_GWF1_44_10]|nr:MAG: HflK protein [Microgenomates group bacterium GW2011_GWF1_44_10]